MSLPGFDLRELDRDRLEALLEEVERELENRRFEERLLWELRRQGRNGASAR